MSSLIQDLRFVLRLLRKNPVSSAVIVLTLALGIGANTAMFAAFDAWVLRPLDLERPEALVALEETRPKLGDRGYGVSVANLRDWQSQSTSFEAISAYRRRVFNLHDENDPDRIRGAQVAASLFPFLGKDPIRGRHFLPAEDVPGGPAVALISHQLWQDRFDADPDILGRTFRLDGVVHEVIGVMPPRFEFPEWAHVWVPLALPVTGERDSRVLRAVARRLPGVSLEQARAELQGIAAGLERLYPETNSGWSAEVQPLRDQWSPAVIRLALSVSIIAAGAVLLVICANVANLLLAQATARRQEVALRTALGASRGRLMRQTVNEGLVLASAGGVLGAIMGGWWVDWMITWAPVEPPYLFRFAVDSRALSYTLAVAVATGLVCALAPVIRSSGLDVAETLKSGGGRTVSGAGGQRLRRLLVVGELAVSVLLMIGALLMVKSFLREQWIEPGYRIEGVLTARLSFTGTAFEDPVSRVAVVERAIDRVSAITGAQTVGASNRLPVSSNGYLSARLLAEGRPIEPGEEPLASYHSITGDYLSALELPLVEGRTFSAGEAGGGQVALVSRSLADRLWPKGGALGGRIRDIEGEQGWLRVVGVVGDIDPGHSMVGGSWPQMQIYVPWGTDPAAVVTLAVRTAGDPSRLSSAIRSELRQVAPGVPVSHVSSLEQVVGEVHWVSGFFSRLFSQYAIIALVIAALGAYGIIADSVSQRTREMGIRLALGARPRNLLALVVAEGAGLGLLGAILGVLAAIPATHFLASMLYQVSATDPTVFAGVAVLLVGVALLAAYLPARRAASVDPMEVLRFE